LKALVYWCRWNGARLRLLGRSDDAVWGELVFADHSQPFHFLLEERLLTTGEGQGRRAVFLDEMGVERRSAGEGGAGDAPG
jgi:hypothetical protein